MKSPSTALVGRAGRQERFGQGDTQAGCLMDRIGAWTAFQLLGDASRRVMRISQRCRRRGHRYLEQLAKRHRTPSGVSSLSTRRLCVRKVQTCEGPGAAASGPQHHVSKLGRSGRLGFDHAFGAATDERFGDLLRVERCLRLRVDRDDRPLLADRFTHLQVAQNDAGERWAEAEEGL